MRPLTILMLHMKPYPCSHAMLETVYTRVLPQRQHTITWVMRSAGRRPIRGWDMAEWNETQVYLLEGDQQKGKARKLLGRFMNQYRVVRHIMSSQKPDIIQVRNDWIQGLIGAYVQRRWKVPFVYQVSFPTPEMQMYRGGWRWMLGWFMKTVQRFLLKEAALVLPISQWMQKQFEDEGVPARKMLSFPMGADTSIRPEEVDGEDIRRRLGLGDCPTLIYFGEMERARQLDFLLRVVELVARKITTVRLLMVGKSEQGEQDIEWLKSVALDLGIANHVIFTGYVPRTEVSRYIAAANVGVSPFRPLPIVYDTASPTKLVETMAMAKPVVANDIPEQKLILSESGAGICTAYDEKEFAEAILWLLQHPEEARVMGKRGRQYIEEHRSYRILAQRVEEAYYKLLTTGFSKSTGTSVQCDL